MISALLMILANLVSLVEVLRFEDKKSWRFAFGLIAAIVMIGLGVTMIIAGESVIASFQQGIGVLLIINALINIWYIVRLGKQSKKASQAK